MRYKSLIIISLILFTAVAHARHKPGTLKECQKIKDRIDEYTDLRRAGGTSRQMHNWQVKQNRYKDKYTEKDCMRYRNHLE